jgi:hypothetical protein
MYWTPKENQRSYPGTPCRIIRRTATRPEPVADLTCAIDLDAPIVFALTARGCDGQIKGTVRVTNTDGSGGDGSGGDGDGDSGDGSTFEATFDTPFVVAKTELLATQD